MTYSSKGINSAIVSLRGACVLYDYPYSFQLEKVAESFDKYNMSLNQFERFLYLKAANDFLDLELYLILGYRIVNRSSLKLNLTNKSLDEVLEIIQFVVRYVVENTTDRKFRRIALSLAKNKQPVSAPSSLDSLLRMVGIHSEKYGKDSIVRLKNLLFNSKSLMLNLKDLSPEIIESISPLEIFQSPQLLEWTPDGAPLAGLVLDHESELQ